MSDPPADDPDPDGRHLAHDLLQSVAIIQSIVAATRITGDLDQQVDANLAIIAAEARAMGELCQQRIDGGRTAVPLDLGALVERVAERMRTLYPGTIETEVADPTPASLTGDVLDWERSLLNLLENACRAAGVQGKVSIRAHRLGATYRVVVADSGPGFGEAPAGRSSLGMVTVSRLVDRHQGHVELRRGPLGGAQVSIVIPDPEPGDDAVDHPLPT